MLDIRPQAPPPLFVARFALRSSALSRRSSRLASSSFQGVGPSDTGGAAASTGTGFSATASATAGLSATATGFGQSDVVGKGFDRLRRLVLINIVKVVGVDGVFHPPGQRGGIQAAFDTLMARLPAKLFLKLIAVDDDLSCEQFVAEGLLRSILKSPSLAKAGLLSPRVALVAVTNSLGLRGVSSAALIVSMPFRPPSASSRLTIAVARSSS